MATRVVCALAVLGLARGCTFEVHNISDLCGAIANQSCVTWTGDGQDVPEVNPVCELDKDFELTCAPGSNLALFESLRFTLTADGNLTVNNCDVAGYLSIVGDLGVLNMDGVVVKGSMTLQGLADVQVGHLVVEGAGSQGAAFLHLASLRNFFAESVVVRQTAAKGDLYCLLADAIGLPLAVYAIKFLKVENCDSSMSAIRFRDVNSDWEAVDIRNCSSDSVIVQSTTTDTTVGHLRVTGSRSSNSIIRAINANWRFVSVAVENCTASGLLSGSDLIFRASHLLTYFNRWLDLGTVFANYFPYINVEVSNLASICNTVTGAEVTCNPSGGGVSLGTWEVELPDGASHGLTSLCGSDAAVGGNLYTDAELPSDPIVDRLTKHASRGTCSEDACSFQYPAGHNARVRLQDLLSQPLDAITLFNETGFPLAAFVPPALTEAFTMYQHPSGGIGKGESLELQCCGAASDGCDVFVGVGGGAGGGLRPGLEADARWEKRVCTMQFGEGTAVPSQTMVVYQTRMSPGSVQFVPAGDGATAAFVVLARQANASRPEGEFCTLAGGYVGPTLSSAALLLLLSLLTMA
ncbi:hypothetical protein DIPPA_16381 [Diplonema papillatum]|nr:hypothetical protein DIPPA_16381 [Diplonema papillatum]